MVLIENGPDVTRRGLGKGVPFEQRQDLWTAFEQPEAKVHEPAVVLIVAEGSEPHLPIQPRLVGFDKSGPPVEGAWFVLEFVLKPGDAVVASLDDDLVADSSHHREQAIT